MQIYLYTIFDLLMYVHIYAARRFPSIGDVEKAREKGGKELQRKRERRKI
jgi:hypothetical protein